MPFSTKSLENEFKQEAKILKTLNHPHIIKIVKSHISDEERHNLSRQGSGDSRKSNNSHGSNSGGESNDASLQSKSDF